MITAYDIDVYNMFIYYAHALMNRYNMHFLIRGLFFFFVITYFKF